MKTCKTISFFIEKFVKTCKTGQFESGPGTRSATRKSLEDERDEATSESSSEKELQSAQLIPLDHACCIAW